MLELNKIYNEDCINFMNNMQKEGCKVDIVLTSPPYNTSRVGRKDIYSTRYDGFLDNKTDEEYIEWIVTIFNKYDGILSQNGVVLFNISYSSENTSLLWRTISHIIEETNFTTADCITWKKRSAIPNNVSKNKLTRIVEYVFVLCRKDELNTFRCNKKVKSVNERTNQNYYQNVFNYIEAPNNDGKCEVNRATYSSELCLKLLEIYANEQDVVYDSFMGSGTTGVACVKYGCRYIGSEISTKQCDYAAERINTYIE